MSKQQLGESLKSIRLSKKVSTYAMQKKMNLGTMLRIENGDKDYKIDSLIQYCKILDINIKFIASK